jgi:ADP-heptose:LPS heptosyltransferase
MLDKGGGGEETARAEALEQSCRGALYTWQGSFAPFAEAIRASRLYIGYDSAGQHVAAACGVRQITVFAGAPNRRFIERWRPWAVEGRAALVEAGSF